MSTVGLNEAKTAKYVREQGGHDQLIDRVRAQENEALYGVRGQIIKAPT